MTSIPKSALWLGLAGLLPFLFGAGLALSPEPDLPPGQFASIYPSDAPAILAAYGTVILCFMSGVLWGFAAQGPKDEAPLGYALSVIPALYAFFFCQPHVFAFTPSNLDSLRNLGIGFVGVLVILQPGYAVFAPAAVVPLASAFMFALYGLLTRYAARKDSTATSFFWTGVSGAVVMTVIGIWYWEPMTAGDWLWMGALCITGASGHWLLIKTYEVAEASAVQPFAYLQLVFAAAIGIFLMGETLRPNVALGAAIVVGAGLFTLWRARRAS